MGLRCSKRFALKWEDIHWEELSRSVRRAIVDGVVGDVNTKYSESRLPLDPALAETLFNWNRKSLFGRDNDWLLPSAHEAGENPTAVGQNVGKADQTAGAAAQIGTEIGWHPFRHTYSSMLRQLGVDAKVQQELLRHADAGRTLNLYSQAISEQKRSAHSAVLRTVLPPTEVGESQAIGHFWTGTRG